jgi:hypothetical protein
VGAQATRDYPLFNPRHHFPNQVVSWGIHPFEPARLESLLAADRITHIVIEDDRALGYHWAGGMQTAPMVGWLRKRRDFREIPLKTEHQCLFERVEPQHAPP